VRSLISLVPLYGFFSTLRSFLSYSVASYAISVPERGKRKRGSERKKGSLELVEAARRHALRHSPPGGACMVGVLESLKVSSLPKGLFLTKVTLKVSSLPKL